MLERENGKGKCIIRTRCEEEGSAEMVKKVKG